MAFPIVAALGVLTAGLGLLSDYKKADNDRKQYNYQVDLLEKQGVLLHRQYMMQNSANIINSAKKKYLEFLALKIEPDFNKRLKDNLFIYLLFMMFFIILIYRKS